jgi:hypothetical protein
MSVSKKGKKARKVKHFGWQIGPSFIIALPATFLTLFFALAPIDPSYHSLHFVHDHPHHSEMAKIQKYTACFREDEIRRMLHRA